MVPVAPASAACGNETELQCQAVQTDLLSASAGCRVETCGVCVCICDSGSVKAQCLRRDVEMVQSGACVCVCEIKLSKQG